MSATILTFGRHHIAADLSVVEFLVGMALCRRGPSPLPAVASEVSRLFDKPIRRAELAPALARLMARRWAFEAGGAYAMTETGVEALRGCYAAMVRLLDDGRRLLDVAVFMSLIQEFERTRS